MINRRDFIRLGAAGGLGLLIGIPLPSRAAGSASSLHPLIRIDEDSRITLYARNPEMGQDVKTALPMIIAEELGVDWHAVDIRQAGWDPRLEDQFSGGSLSVRLNYNAMRQAGATARAMLIAAAALRLGQDANTLTTEMGFVIDASGDMRLSYGELAGQAATMPVPDEPTLRDASEFRLIGKSVADVDLHAIVRRQQVYSLDFTVPDMLYAAVVRCPHAEGQPKSFDDHEAKNVPGVTGFHLMRNIDHGGRIILPNGPANAPFVDNPLKRKIPR